MLSNAHGSDDAVQDALRVTAVTMRLLAGIVSQHLDTYDEPSEWTR